MQGRTEFLAQQSPKVWKADTSSRNEVQAKCGLDRNFRGRPQRADFTPAAVGGSGVTTVILRCPPATARIHLDLVTGVYQPPVASVSKIGECIYVVPVRCELNP
ncbi:hypothetical protein BDD14_0718 [Edaphobacter modestus]|uniref:Uncharacterized protein n=1 Tax=Edaphobacter modestus TaxID=388466 RepID=A0A4Q7YNX2_9BACT|nr:hypothetical protein BDD14_0718 [Edaphobacter modestus]